MLLLYILNKNYLKECLFLEYVLPYVILESKSIVFNARFTSDSCPLQLGTDFGKLENKDLE